MAIVRADVSCIVIGRIFFRIDVALVSCIAFRGFRVTSLIYFLHGTQCFRCDFFSHAGGVVSLVKVDRYPYRAVACAASNKYKVSWALSLPAEWFQVACVISIHALDTDLQGSSKQGNICRGSRCHLGRVYLRCYQVLLI